MLLILLHFFVPIYVTGGMIYNRTMEIYINEISKINQITNDESTSIIKALLFLKSK